MQADLIITNGDSAGRIFTAAGIGKQVLPWRDMLHEGPVENLDDLAALSARRAVYIGSVGLGRLIKLQSDFAHRDELLARNEDFGAVTLCFEHDLYDQLQLLQILDWFAANWRNDGHVYLVQADTYLTTYTSTTIGKVEQLRTPITGLQLSIAKTAWAAFRHDTPEPWARLLDEDLAALPYLKPAILRMLEELPSTFNGLSRIEQAILTLIDKDICEPRYLFSAYMETEDARFLGDGSFYKLLEGLANSDEPLIAGLAGAVWEPQLWTLNEQKNYMQAKLQLTSKGTEVLAGRADHAQNNNIDRWWGGTHLTGKALWRWDGDAKRLVIPGVYKF